MAKHLTWADVITIQNAPEGVRVRPYGPHRKKSGEKKYGFLIDKGEDGTDSYRLFTESEATFSSAADARTAGVEKLEEILEMQID